MSEREVFNQKLEQIGGGEIAEGISIRGDNKEKILEFINANTNCEYSLNNESLQKNNINSQGIIQTLLDEEIAQAINEQRKIVLNLSNDIEEDLEIYISPDNAYERIILINATSFIKENLEDIALADRLTKALFKIDEGISLLSSTAIKAVISTASNVYHGPDSSNYASVGSIDAGEDPVYILATSMEWYHIEYVVTSTGKHKTGYIPASVVSSYSGGTPTEEDFYGGYCYATTELDVRTCDDFSLTAPVGTLYKNEGCTFLFSYQMGSNEVAFIEYATSSGTKRGYVYSRYLNFPCETIVCVAKENIAVYGGPSNTTYANFGTIYENELMSLLAKEGNWIYVEYNTTKGRKRGYVEWNKVDPRDYTAGTYFNDFYTTPSNSACHVIDEKVTVYGGPTTDYANIGSVNYENITSFWTNNSTFNLTCIEYVVTSTGLLKRGYIDSTKIVEGGIALENNEIESFDSSYSYFGNKIIYGQTQLGRDMFYYKAGTGDNHLFMVFAQHGWEDGTTSTGSYKHGDGNMLLKMAKNFITRFINMNSSDRTTILNNWSIYLFPGINLDGIVNGYTNGGFGRCFYNGIDPNRSWPGNFQVFTNPRNKTGSSYLGAQELTNLKNVLTSQKGSGENILLDLHGWENSCITNSQTIADYFLPQLKAISSNCVRKNLGVASGYLATWAANSSTLQTTSSNMAGLGASTALIEFPPTTDYSDSNMQLYGEKLFNATTNLLLAKSTSTPATSNNAELYLQLAELYVLASNWNDSDNVAENNRLVLDYLRHEGYSSLGTDTIYSESDLLSKSSSQILDIILNTGMGGAFDLVAGSLPKPLFYAFVELSMIQDLSVSNIKVHINSINKEVPLDHFAVSALTAMNRTNPYFIDLNSWAGDLIQLLGKCQNLYDSASDSDKPNYDFNYLQLKNLIGCTDNDYVDGLGFGDNVNNTGFSYEDLYQDIDALVLADDLKSKPIYEVFDDYYNNGGDDNRIPRFIEKIISTNSGKTFPAGSTDGDKVEYLARQYVARELPGLNNTLLEFFKFGFGDWDSNRWGAKAALGFRTKVESL